MRLLQIALVASSLLSTNLLAADKAVGAPKSTIENAAPTVVDFDSPCALCVKSNRAKPKVRLEPELNKKSIEVTLLSESDVEAIFKKLAKVESIPFAFSFDGGYARAHATVQLLERNGVISGKAWVVGNVKFDSAEFGEIELKYHVAPVVMVETGNGNVPYVLDPSMMGSAVPFREWRNKLSSKKGSFISSEYFTNRFAYGPDEKNDDYDSYDDETEQDVRKKNDEYNRLLRMIRERRKK